MKRSTKINLVPVERVQRSILLIRGQRVIVATDLAKLYGVPVKRLNEAVKRNLRRFPDDFMFQLTWDEAAILRSQFATLRLPAETPSGSTHGRHSKYRPFAFTEHGAIMAATVLNSRRAVEMSIFVVRAFVELREILASHEDLRHKLESHDARISRHDEQFTLVLEAIQQLMEQPDDPPKPPIGFHTEIAGHSTRKAKRNSA